MGCASAATSTGCVRTAHTVTDRGLAKRVDAAEWQRIAATMSVAFKAGGFETGLNQAVDAVDALLVQHFPLAPGEVNPNELPDAPYLR